MNGTIKTERALAATVSIFLVSLAVIVWVVKGLPPPSSEGEFEFRLHCSQCHGMGAIGNGPVAPALNTKPANLRMLTKKNGGIFPEREIYDFIDGTKQIAAHGSRKMPIWGLASQYPRRHNAA
jgi:hypothetical protein